MQKGFTLLEVLFSLFLLTAAMVGAASLLLRITSFLPVSKGQLQASYLAQEGVEIVRNMRDANIIKINKTGAGNWNDGLTSCAASAGCEADYNDTSLAAFGHFLQINNGFYEYGFGGITTPFQRKITIDTGTSDKLKVTVQVLWQEKNQSHSLTVRDDLYKRENW